MTATHQRTRLAAIAVLATFFLFGCYSVAPPVYAPASGDYYEYGDDAAPSGSVGFAVVTYAPPPPRFDGFIWYYGSHPHSADYAHARFCPLSGAHRHAYTPYWNHHYAFHDGYYFWVGDPTPFGLHGSFYAYQGHHRHPHYFGDYCRISGRHHHVYAPPTRHSYLLHNGTYYYTGSYDRDYYTQRDQYDARGLRKDRLAGGYRNHEHARQRDDAREREHTRESDGTRDHERAQESDDARDRERTLQGESAGEQAPAQPKSDGIRKERVKRSSATSAREGSREDPTLERPRADSAEEQRTDRVKLTEPQRASRARTAREPGLDRSAERELSDRDAPDRRRARDDADRAARESGGRAVQRAAEADSHSGNARERRAQRLAREREAAAQNAADAAAANGANE